MKVGLVACCSSKLTRAVPAWQLYTSPLFRLSVAYLTQKVGVDRWYVLSAKHGLVAPETVLEPYDETLTRASKAEREAWGERVAEQLYAAWRKAGVEWDITALAGSSYCQPLRKALNAKVNPLANICALRLDEPLHGKGIGERLQWLSREVVPGNRHDAKKARNSGDLDELMRQVHWHHPWGTAQGQYAVVDGVPVTVSKRGLEWAVEVKRLTGAPMMATAATGKDAKAAAIAAARTGSWLVVGYPTTWHEPAVEGGDE